MAINQAFEHEYEPDIDHKHCAVLVKGGSVISIGFNKMNTNSFVEYYTDKVRGPNRDYCLSTHAEQSTILDTRNKIDLNGCKIYVARIRPSKSPNGKVGLSKPCNICTRVLMAYGVSKAYYTIDDYSYGVLDVRKMKEDKFIYHE
jgi:deoxycytidylate deaminase